MALIGLGVVMLMQPLSLDLYGYSFVTILAGTLGFVVVSHFPEYRMAEIRLETVSKTFGSLAAVKDVTLKIDDGTFFAMLGPSGCGKTTTLRMIAGLELPTAGRILLDGEDVTAERAAARDIAFVFQLFALYPHMNVRQNIAFPLRCQNLPRAEVRGRVEETARLLRIEALLDRRVGGLSGGDRQRVALGRAIVRRPKAFLMDEPLGALDAEFRRLMCGELRELHDRIRATTVYITHDQLEAMAMADRIAVMKAGMVEQIGTPQEIYDRPRTMFVAEFIGAPPMNLLNLEAAVRRGDQSLALDGGAIEVPEIQEDRAAGPLALGVRPEHVSLADAAALRGRVFGTEYLGTTQIVTIVTAYGQVKARLSSKAAVQRGETVGLALQRDRLCLFDAATGRALQSALYNGAYGG
jgi:multiple sugar transport system ATP-binding protein